jgi:hypothetical protein
MLDALAPPPGRVLVYGTANGVPGICGRKKAKSLVRSGRATWISDCAVRKIAPHQHVSATSRPHTPPDLSALVSLVGTDGVALPVTPEWLYRMGYEVFGQRMYAR